MSRSTEGPAGLMWRRVSAGAVILALMTCSPALAAKKSSAPAKAAAPAAPAGPNYQAAIDAAFAKYKDTHEGKNADYI
ncbi:MAG TPA: hypothetical protein VMJ70_11520, partial [Candidatus Sulfotelmatobacter sp.]|nr:hypothetical protein [Candidatus Sulfotelmatobacter sp.]